MDESKNDSLKHTFRWNCQREGIVEAAARNLKDRHAAKTVSPS